MLRPFFWHRPVTVAHPAGDAGRQGRRRSGGGGAVVASAGQGGQWWRWHGGYGGATSGSAGSAVPAPGEAAQRWWQARAGLMTGVQGSMLRSSVGRKLPGTSDWPRQVVYLIESRYVQQ